MRWSKRLLPALAVLGLAVAAWWPLSRQQAPEPVVTAVPGEPRPDYYLRDFTVDRSDASGRWDYRIRAESMLHFPDSESWTVDRPRLSFFGEDGVTWLAQAESGRVWADGEEAELLGEVILERPPGPERGPLTLITRDLYLRPGEHYAETRAPVLVRQAEQGELRGVGARAYLDEERYELLSQVKGNYVPAEP